jgi:flap endonuclease-1
MPGKMSYVTVEPELIEHKQVLAELHLDNDQLRALALLIGTDYNVGGIKGIGPKKGLKLVQEHGHDFSTLFSDVQWSEHCQVPWEDIVKVFHEMPVIDPGRIQFGNPNPAKVREILVERHDFGEERIGIAMERLMKEVANKQKWLGDFF